jgi:hypothetical protein
MRRRLLVEESGPEFQYIKGKHNFIMVGTLSRLEMEPSEQKYEPTFQCMAATMARCPCILNDLDPDVFENAENFSETTKDRADFQWICLISLKCKKRINI